MTRKYLTDSPALEIDSSVDNLSPDRVLVVTDKNVEKIVLPRLKDSSIVREAPRFTMTPGETEKNLATVIKVWEKLEEIGATRKSLVLNIGGGVVTDLGGFAAATFKRGIRTINFPTTLLGAVDAATGGKTGIDFNGLKNEIGAFHNPSKVIISPIPFETLPQEELLSGYAEMVKTALFSSREFYISLLDIERMLNDSLALGEAVEQCVRIKEEVVEQDPREKGLRKVLNLGHTAGHAFESFRLLEGKPVTHGKAVAHGLLVTLILSHLILGFDSKEIYHYRDFLRENYGGPLIECRDIEEIIGKMNSDKKNRRYGQPLFTLLKDIGVAELDIEPSQEDLRRSLEIYRGEL
ncbi:MAG: 3-dehydroquinate synthase [Muribaculaceae bacterium]|nr:3-dehydroquinate synthase [Muribaculaceae bacterium]